MNNNKLFMVFFILLLRVPLAYCQEWQSLGPFGGNFTDIAYSLAHPNILYAGTVKGGLFKTTNSGKSWIYCGLKGDHILSIAVDPKNADKIFISRRTNDQEKYSATLLSEDGGTTWQEIPYYSNRIFISPDSEIVFIGSSGGLYKSTDGGISFTGIEYDFGHIYEPVLVFDPVQPKILYLGTNDAIYKSLNRGKSWIKLADFHYGSTSADISCIAVSPVNNQRIVAGSRNKHLFVSVDGGVNWKNIDRGCQYYTVFCDDNDENIFYTGHLCGFYKSEDFGETLTEIQNFSVVGGEMVENSIYLLD